MSDSGDQQREEAASDHPPDADKDLDSSERTTDQERPSEATGSDAPRASNRNSCVVVGIGASAGGLESFTRLLKALPSDNGVAYVLVQHLDPTHESLMADLLAKHTKMPVTQVKDAEPIRPDHVYMIPPDKYLRVQDGGLFLEQPQERRGIRMPIDYFFRSLAESRGRKAICIVLSGTGSDGTLGLKEVKGAGGMAIVQKPQTAQYDGMPRSALASGMVDFVVPIEEMPEIIERYTRHPYVRSSETDEVLSETAPDHFRSIIHLLKAHTAHDFRCYKKGTLNRRIQRRMSVLQVENLGAYVKRLRNDPNEVQLLYKDLLIGVTSFFRDPEAWAELEETLEALIERNVIGETIRVWTAGCATGEEAYSLAIMLDELMKKKNRRVDVQIFATDIDAEAVAIAREGVYPESIAGDLSQRRLDRFFTEENGKYRIRKRLREMCIFAVQNLVGDPPFSNLEIVLCRNVMIYLEASIQRRMVEMFHFALDRDGILFLGTSESVVRHGNFFEPISKGFRIYKKINAGPRGTGTFPINTSRGSKQAESGSRANDPKPRTPAEAAREVLLAQYAPAAVLINKQYEVHYFHGAVRDYLDFPSGTPTNDLSEMIWSSLKSKLRGAVLKAVRENSSVSVVAPGIDRNTGRVDVRIDAVPVPPRGDEEPWILVAFSDEQPVRLSPPPDDAGEATESGSEVQVIRQLEHELQATREDLQTTIEELETSNEELKASNEEIMLMNEELQSTNEELETSREELQSLNEELNTVNSQLEDKVRELEDSNNDLTNLFTSTDVATLFLDTDLRIRRFTPGTTDLLQVISTDVGRPVADLAPQVNDPTLLEDAKTVLDTLIPLEKEVNSSQRAFLRRVLPYRTSENRIDGAVITFSDITSLSSARSMLESRERQQAAVAELGQIALSQGDLQSVFDAALQFLREILAVPLVKVLRLLPDGRELLLQAGLGWDQAEVGTSKVPAGPDSQAGFTLEKSVPVVVPDLGKEKRFNSPKLLRDHGVVSGISVVIGPREQPWGVLGIHERSPREFNADDINFVRAVSNVLYSAVANDASARRIREREQRIRSQYNELEAVYQQAPVGLAVHDLDLKIVRINGRLASINGVSPADVVGHRLSDVCPHVAVPVEDQLRTVFQTGEAVVDSEISGVAAGDPHVQRYWNASYFPISSDKGRIESVITVVQEITTRKRYEQSRTAAYGAARQLASFDQIHQALPAVLRAFALPLELTLCEFWQPDSEGNFRCVHFCVPSDPDHEPEIEKQFDDIVLSADEGLVGEAATTRQVQIATDLYVERAFVRNSSAEDLDLCSGLAVPVLVGEELFGVITFFSRRRFAEAHQLEDIASNLGRDVAQFVRRVRAEEESEQARLAANAANQAKSEFLANMSHEIRTPMSAIMGFANILSEHSSDPDDLQCLEIIRRNGDHLLQIINDILDLSKIEANKLSLSSEQVSCVDVASEVVSLMDVRAKEKGLGLRAEFEGRVPKTFYTDPVRLRQILVNLVSNAIKFTDSGEIRLRVAFDSAAHRVKFSVADTGIGISEQAMQHLFEPFNQGDGSDARQHGGTGLGLTICRRLAAMLDGELGVESSLGEGSRFNLALPVDDDSASELVEATGVDANEVLRQQTTGEGDSSFVTIQGRILVVDDRREMRMLTQHFLERASAAVQTAESGQQAIDLVEEAERSGTPFDLVVLDMQMPDIDGYETCQLLRRKRFSGPIIALTANAMEGDRKACLQAGCDDYITKPIDAKEFVATIARHLHPQAGLRS